MSQPSPLPLDGSFIDEKLGIRIRTNREADTIKLLNMAVYYNCFTWEGEFGHRFRVSEENGVWVANTFGYNRVIVNKRPSIKFCKIYGLEWVAWTGT